MQNSSMEDISPCSTYSARAMPINQIEAPHDYQDAIVAHNTMLNIEDPAAVVISDSHPKDADSGHSNNPRVSLSSAAVLQRPRTN